MASSLRTVDRRGRRSGPGWCRTIRATQDLPQRLAGPSWAHPLGLDELGRDVLARLRRSARAISLLVGVTVVVASRRSSASPSARSPATLGGWIDDVARTRDGRAAGVSRHPARDCAGRRARPEPDATSCWRSCTIGWVGYARLVRGQVLKIRELEYVQAARALGAPVARVLLRHVIPATLSAVTVQATLGMAGAIIAEASLSFLGLGVQPPTPSWGTMLDAGRSHLFDAPHLTLVHRPGAGDRASLGAGRSTFLGRRAARPCLRSPRG